MPVPETFLLYGQDDIVAPSTPNNPGITTSAPRDVTRTITLHYTHGWCYNSEKGVHFWLDLDGTLYQNNEADRPYRHVTGGPYFNSNTDAVRNNNANTVRNTSVGIEICRFGKFKQKANGDWIVVHSNEIKFEEDTSDPEWCEYGTSGVSTIGTGPLRFNLWKIPGGDTFQKTGNFSGYKIKAAEFNDDRNPERPEYVRDILFSEEQHATLVLWLKSILEHYRIPKQFLHDPETGKENPWIDTRVLAQSDKPASIRDEAIERAASHQGVWGHMNLQADRFDPGASVDYYRLKRGVSDSWWYPVNLDDSERAINYLDQTRSADYLNLSEYGDIDNLESYFRLNEDSETGFYPIGKNRVWHGGIHLNSSADKPVYAMANGDIVAARVTNGQVNGEDMPYSRCFVLIKHQVHTQNVGDEIDYSQNSTHIIYSLYMHLQPIDLEQRDDGNGGQRWKFDYQTMPTWLCHFLIDNPTVAGIEAGALLYPNKKVDLSDQLGRTGTYIVGVEGDEAQYGQTVHVEVFTTESPREFAQNNPWWNDANRVVDPTSNNAIADEGVLDGFIRDAAGDGIDTADIKNAAPGMRDIAVQSLSEWALTSRAQLAHRVDDITQDEWVRLVRPLCFRTDIVADANAPAEQIGPFYTSPTVWHLHPFVFLKWMNERVDRHERILSEQDKSRSNFTPNIVVEDGYVTGFQNIAGANPNQLAQNSGNVNYPDAEYNEVDFGVSVDGLCDQAALTNAAQTATRFNIRLLEVIDICADRQHGLNLIEGYVSAGNVQCSKPEHHNAHRSGDAVDVRPDPRRDNGAAIHLDVSHWFNLYSSARNAQTYLQEFHDTSLEIFIATDPASAEASQQSLDASATELWRRLQAAQNSADEILHAEPIPENLNKLRLHLGLHAPVIDGDATLENLRWLSSDGVPTSGPAIGGQRLQIAFQTRNIQDGATAHVFILAELFSKTIAPDIQNASSLQSIYGSLDFDISEIERHETRETTVDSFVQRLEKQVSGVQSSGVADIVCDWVVPDLLPHASGTLYAVCIVSEGSQQVTGGHLPEHLIAEVGADARIQVPNIRRTSWASDASGAQRSTALSFREHDEAFIIVDAVALPAGCTISISVRDLEDNGIILEQTRPAIAGTNSIVFTCPAPRRKESYHATIRVESDTLPIDLTSGAGIEWVRRL